MDTSKRHLVTFCALIALVALTAGGTALAGAVVDYARNADKVDGRHAVDASSSRRERAGKLVATNQKGRLPRNILAKVAAAENADRLQGFGEGAFVHECQDGGLRGQARVPSDVGPTFETVSGFSTTYGGPLERDGSPCHQGKAEARRVSLGVYDVRLATIAWPCDQPLQEDIMTALVSVEGAEPLIATYEPSCDKGVSIRVRVFDLKETPTDSAFSVALLESHGIPIP